MTERFLAGGWRMPLISILAVAMPIMGVYHLVRVARWSGLAALADSMTGICFVAMGLAFAWAWSHRRRPVIEVGEDAVEYGSIFRARRQRLARDRIARVESSGSQIRLTLVTGEVVPLPAPELSPAARRRARLAIERRLSRA